VTAAASSMGHRSCSFDKPIILDMLPTSYLASDVLTNNYTNNGDNYTNNGELEF
jgi:hypothetical protein